MARDSKIEVAAVNVRIATKKHRNYVELFSALRDLRRPVRVYGDTHLVITYFDETSNRGVISKYTEIEMNGQWFDTSTFDAATPEDVGKIKIPATLKPNFSQFSFLLDEQIHTVAFEAYSDSKSLSLAAVERYFSSILSAEEIAAQFGHIASNIISNYQAAKSLLELPDLKEIRITIRSLNPDDLDPALARDIEERLHEQHGTEYEEALKIKGPGSLRPNARTKKLAAIGAESGDVEVQNIANGVRTRSRSSDTPLKEVEKFKADEATLPRFHALAKRIFDKVRKTRRAADA